jgi:DNA-binding GntR family transcriptional regulator
VLKRSSLREQIRDHLLEMIGRGELMPGDRVVEAKLAQQLGVSTIPVREAVRELVVMGILDCAPHKGAQVRTVNLQDTIAALQVRSAIEPLGLTLAAAGLKTRCAELRREAKFTLDAAVQRDFAAYQRHNQIFHRLIMEASGNRVLLKVWDSLSYELGVRVIVDPLPPESAVLAAREHDLVVEAIANDEIDRAAALLAGHARRLIEHLQGELNRLAMEKRLA